MRPGAHVVSWTRVLTSHAGRDRVQGSATAPGFTWLPGCPGVEQSSVGLGSFGMSTGIGPTVLV